MKSSSELLAVMEELIEGVEDWEKEVQFNCLRQFAVHLVCLTHPEFAPSYMALAKQETYMPKGILMISAILNHSSLSDENKISRIKMLLLEKGYDGLRQPNCFGRTKKTHEVYSQLAGFIMEYEKNTTLDLGVICRQ